MSLSVRPKLSSSRRIPRAAVCLLLTLPLFLPTLSACSAEIDQRAVQPGQVISGSPSTDSTGALETPLSGPAGLASPTSLESLFPTSTASKLPAPSRAYFIHGGDLWQVPFGPGEGVPVVTGKSILAFAPSPDGEQVAVVYLEPGTGKEHLADVRADSSTVVDVELALPSDDQSAHGGDIQSLAWAPMGDQVAVARQDGSISVVKPTGTITQIVGADDHRFPGSLSFSSDGRTLLFMDPDLPGRATSLYAVPSTGGGAQKLIDGTASGYPVLQAHWLPGGTIIAYSQAIASSPPGTGDVFSIDAVTRSSRLVIPSAQFAPVAGIGDFAFSPDGEWVAFTVYVPNGAGIQFQGLWLMNLLTGATQRVKTVEDQTATDLWWGADSLIFRTVKSGPLDTPKHYTGVEPYWIYAVNTTGGSPVLRYHSP